MTTESESTHSRGSLRYFNKLSFEPRLALLTKTSVRAEQLRNQVRWFRLAPKCLANHLPRIHDSSDADEPFITMEMFAMPTLAEHFIAQTLPPIVWAQIANKLQAILAAMLNHGCNSPQAHTMAAAMYVDKTRLRLEEFILANPLAPDCYVQHEGRRINLPLVLTQLEGFVEQAGLLKIDRLSPIHGDLCFSNILLDPKSGDIKLIDPRGEFGLPGLFGDPRYDLAKLAQSFAGGYDFIISDRFTVDLAADGEITLTERKTSYHTEICQVFATEFLVDPVLADQVLAIQALLFLSMLPMHSDEPGRQLAMLATGLRVFGQCQTALGL